MGYQVQLYEGYAKVLLVAVLFVISLIKLRRRNFHVQGIVCMLFLLCQLVANAYWQINYLLYEEDRFIFLSAEDFSFYGTILLASVLVEMDDRGKVSNGQIIFSILLNLCMGVLYFCYGDNVFEAILSACVMGYLAARILKSCSDLGFMSSLSWGVMLATAVSVVAIEASLFMLDGSLSKAADIASNVIKGIIFIMVMILITKAFRRRADALLSLSAGGYLLSTYWAFLSTGIVYEVYDFMQAAFCIPIMIAVFGERRSS